MQTTEISLFSVLQQIQSPPKVKAILNCWVKEDQDKQMDEVFNKTGISDKGQFLKLLEKYPDDNRSESIQMMGQLFKLGIRPSMIEFLHHLLSDPQFSLVIYLNRNGVRTGKMLKNLKILMQQKKPGIAKATFPDHLFSNENNNTINSLGGFSLTQEALQGKYEFMADRPNLIFKLKMVLARKEKSNVLLVGESRSGKTSLVKLLARKIVDEEIALLKGKDIYQINISHLISNTMYRGEFESKILNLFEALGKNEILFIDEIHTAFGAGNPSMNAANMFKPFLDNSKYTLIGATTQKEYQAYIKSDPAFSNRFEVIQVSAIIGNELKNIIELKCKEYQQHYSLSIDQELMEHTINISKKLSQKQNLTEVIINHLQTACILCKEAKQTKLTIKELVQAISINEEISPNEIYEFLYQ
jgi:ATP-dependent Clp protease ATP-binding subunit ClpA